MRLCSLFIFVISVNLFWTGSIANAEDLETIVAEAIDKNQDLASMQMQIVALKSKSDAASMWMDPILAVEYSNFPVNSGLMGEFPMTGVQLKLTQKFPSPGKNASRQDVVLAQIESKSSSQKELALQLSTSIKKNYLNLNLVRRMRELTLQHIGLLERLIKRAISWYETGKGDQKNVLKLLLLKEKLRDDLHDFSRKERRLTAAINSALHRAVTIEISTPNDIKAIEPLFKLETLINTSLETRPLLASLEKNALVFEASADLAEIERRPDISVWIGYRIRSEVAMMDDGTDFISIGAAIPIPLDYTGSSSSKKRSALEMASAVRMKRLGVIDSISGAIESHLAEWERAYQKSDHYINSLLPSASEVLNSSLLAFETGRDSFLTIYQAYLDIIQFERGISSAIVETHLHRVSIEGLVGRELTARGAQGEIK